MQVRVGSYMPNNLRKVGILQLNNFYELKSKDIKQKMLPFNFEGWGLLRSEKSDSFLAFPCKSMTKRILLNFSPNSQHGKRI